MIQIKLQCYPTTSGCRLLTYGIFYNGIFCGYARCFCRAQKAAEWLVLTLQ
jgi:hypothetical protein